MLEERAEYGKSIIVIIVTSNWHSSLEMDLQITNLRRMMQFAEIFPDEQIVVSLTRQLSWTHFVSLIPLKDDLQTRFLC